MKQYNPQSHFFTDLSSLAAAGGNDGFGPVAGSLTTKYRVTSKVKAINASSVELYAICDGKMLIQPSTDLNKINIIIKPSTANYSPLKIKYFIYRGVNKADYFTNNVLNQPDGNKPITVKKLWTSFLALNNLTSPSGNILPLDYVYDYAAPGTKLIDEVFRKSLVACVEGDYIGNFNNEIGLEIVLDYGDYSLENQEVLFNFNLEFARAQESIFNTDTLSDNVKKKRFRENVHQFIDAAAFWGSHINCGEIKFKNKATTVSSVTEISKILKKYQTGDKLYIYIQGQNNRSFNYYDSSKKIYGFDINGEENKTNEWPIIIKKLDPGVSGNINFKFDFFIENTKKQEEVERNISLHVIAGNKKDLSIFPLTERPIQSGQQSNQPAINISGQTSTVKIDFPKDTADISCAAFAFFNCRISQKFPFDNYFNHLWIANLKSSLTVAPNEYEVYSCTYDKSRNINLDDAIGETAILQNKVFFDQGKNSMGNKKKRRLYSAIIKDNSNKNSEYDKLNIDSFQSSFVKSNINKQDYFLNLFKGDKDFSIYRGSFTDNSLGTAPVSNVSSLSVFHENLLLNKKSYMFLGITEEEYNLFTIPSGADNIFFNLLEDTTFANETVRKFKLGLRYENASGSISNTIYYPSSEIFIYSVDDLFFFSKEFSEYQTYFNEFAPIKIEFRTLRANVSGVSDVTIYHGQFGFDWLRIGDNFYPSIPTPIGVVPVEPTYKESLTGGYERKGKRSLSDTNSQYETPAEANLFLQREYLCLPTTKIDEYYYVPYLSLFSKIFHDSKISNSNYIVKPPYEAYLQIIVEAYENVNRLDFEYDTTTFSLDKNQLQDKAIGAKRWSNDKYIKITCKKDFSTTKFIKVWATVGAKEKKLAGVIAVNPNDATSRKTLDVVCVKVQTNADIVTLPDHSDYEKGIFENAEKDFLYRALHQVMVVPNMIEIPAYLALENDTRFQVGGQFVEYAAYDNNYVIKTLTNLHTVLKQAFLTPLNARYANTFINFSFGLPFKKDDPTSLIRTKGAVEDIGVHCSALFGVNRETTLGHELLHGLGLHHTHLEKTKLDNGTIYTYSIEDPDKKYTFYHPHFDSLPTQFDKMKATDNIMSYNQEKNTTWQWQKNIIHRDL